MIPRIPHRLVAAGGREHDGSVYTHINCAHNQDYIATGRSKRIRGAVTHTDKALSVCMCAE